MKIIIFDLDGVLIDSPKLITSYLLHTYPTATEETLKEMLCGNFHDELKKLRNIHKIREETEEEEELRRATYSLQKAESHLYKGIRELLESLQKAGHTLAINTSAFEKNCLPLLKNGKVLEFFDCITTADISKSKTEKFKMLKEKYKVPTNKMLFVTDTVGDVIEAKAASIPTVAVTWGAHDRSYFTREKHENLLGIVDSVEALDTFINGDKISA